MTEPLSKVTFASASPLSAARQSADLWRLNSNFQIADPRLDSKPGENRFDESPLWRVAPF
jgi:hypothetical protein